MKCVRYLLARCAIVATLMVLVGCSASGPRFQHVSPIPVGKGVVYVYREGKFTGCAVYGTLKVNDKPVTKVKNGGYYPCICTPGTVELSVSTETTNTATVDVVDGSEHYVRTTVGMGLFVGRLYLNEVSSNTGEKEIAACKLLKSLETPE